MKNSIFFVLLVISNFTYCQYFNTVCEEKGIEAFSLVNEFKYKEAFNLLFINYEKCYKDCAFIRIYNDILSISDENNFRKLKDEDIQREIDCYSKKTEYVQHGVVYYYLRKNDKKKIKQLNEKMVKQALRNYIYFNYIKENPCGDFSLEYEKDKNISFADYGGAYLMYKCGKINEAKEIASIRYKHFKKDFDKKGLLYEGLPRTIIEHYIYSIIFNIELKENEKMLLKEAKKYFPYIFDLYGF